MILNIWATSSYHHHIHFRALFSSTEGWAFWQVFLKGVLSMTWQNQQSDCALICPVWSVFAVHFMGS